MMFVFVYMHNGGVEWEETICMRREHQVDEWHHLLPQYNPLRGQVLQQVCFGFVEVSEVLFNTAVPGNEDTYLVETT